MDLRRFFTASRIIIVAGKGGVGKTTVAATLGVCAASAGIQTQLIEVEGKRGLASLFDEDGLSYDNTELMAADATRGSASLRARTISADAALLDYFDEQGLGRFGKSLTRMQVLETLATSTPGLRDLIVLGKIKQLDIAGEADLIIVDAPASGHAISFLRSARGLQQAVDTGPIRRQANEVDKMLTNGERTQVMLVALPEETPINELTETAFALEDEVGIKLGPAVVNGVLVPSSASTRISRNKTIDPQLAMAAARAVAHWSERSEAQNHHIERLAAELPLDQFVLPRLPVTRLDRSEIEALAHNLASQIHNLGAAS